jgi:competence protein ComEC
MATERDGVRCDAFGCVAQMPGGYILAMVARPDALREDCAGADIVISSLPLRGVCRGPKLVIDKIDVIRNGAYAAWLGNTIVFQTVQQIRGDRPWSRAPWQSRGKRE